MYRDFTVRVSREIAMSTLILIYETGVDDGCSLIIVFISGRVQFSLEGLNFIKDGF